MRNRVLSRSLAIIGASAVLCAFGYAQGFAFTLDPWKKTFEPTLAVKVHTIEDFAGFAALDFDVLALGGAALENGKLFGGFAVAYPWKAAKNLVLDLGAFVRFEEGKPASGGLFFGVRL